MKFLTSHYYKGTDIEFAMGILISVFIVLRPINSTLSDLISDDYNNRVTEAII